MKQWLAGDTVVVRNIAHSDGTVTSAVPTIAICDDAEGLALFLPAGTEALDNYVVAPSERAAAVDAAPDSGGRPHATRRWPAPTIRLYPPGAPFSAWLFFDVQWRVTGWYGNLEAPCQRTPIGIDTQDHALDVVADPEGTWRWKDEVEFGRRLALGLDTPEHQTAVRGAGADFVERLSRRAPPFDRDWEHWRPPQAWRPRTLPASWKDDFGTRFRRRPTTPSAPDRP